VFPVCLLESDAEHFSAQETIVSKTSARMAKNCYNCDRKRQR